MIKSEYISHFDRILDLPEKTFVLYGDRMLVEILPKEELKIGKSNLIMGRTDNYVQETEQGRPTLVMVLLTSKEYFDEDAGKMIKHPNKPGEILMVNPAGLRHYSEFPGLGGVNQNIAITTPTNIQMSWSSVKALEEFKKVIGG